MKMIKITRSLIAIIILLAFSATHTLAKDGYELKFKIKGLRDSLCYLANYYGDKQYLKDSAKADAGGSLVFKGAETLPGGIYLFVFPNKTYFEILIDKEQFFSMECEDKNPIETMKVKGSQENTNFYEYLRFIADKSKAVEPLKNRRKDLSDKKESTAEVDSLIRTIDQHVTDYKKNYIQTHANEMLSKILKASLDIIIPETPTLPSGAKDSLFPYRYYKQHYFDNIDLADDRILRTPIYHGKVSYYLKNMVLQIPDSLIPEADHLIDLAKSNPETYKYMVWYTTNTYETSNIMGMDEVFVHLVKKYYTKEKAPWVDEATLYKIQDRATVLEPILIGKKVKNLILADSLDRYQSLYNVNSPYTILYFWDPDCGHCKKATPLVKAYYDKVKSKGVQVFAVGTEVEVDKWKKYIRENNLDWINVSDPKVQNNFRHEFDISSTPQIFILDKDKKIIAKKIDEETMEKIVNQELEKKSSN